MRHSECPRPSTAPAELRFTEFETAISHLIKKQPKLADDMTVSEGKLLTRNFTNMLEGMVALNAAQLRDFMASRSGVVFPARSYELGLTKYVCEWHYFDHATSRFGTELCAVEVYINEECQPQAGRQKRWLRCRICRQRPPCRHGRRRRLHQT